MNVITSELGYSHIFILALIFIISIVSLRRKYRVQLNEPPLVPYKYPIIGHTFMYYKDVAGFLKKCREEHGDIFSLYMWGTIQTYVGKETYSEVFKNHRDFSYHGAMDDIAPINYFLGRPAGYFNDLGSFVKEFLVDLTLFGERPQQIAIKAINELIGEGKLIESPPLKVITQIVSRMFAPVIVGEELCEDTEMLEVIASARSGLILLLSVPPLLNFIYPGLHRAFLIFKYQYFDNPVKQDQKFIVSKITPIIKKRITDRNNLGNSWKRPDDMLQALMEKFEIDKNNVDIECVADYLLSVLFAAINTTSTTLLQCLCEYANYPEYHKELIEEAENSLKNKSSPYLTVNEIFKMKKLDNFVKETLRINRHVVALPRKNVSEQFTFTNGYQVPKYRTVATFQQNIHFDPETFGSTPEKFNPNHHINSPASRPEKRFLAFSIGKFKCPGRIFAVNEMKHILHYIILNYNIKSESGKHIEPKSNGGYLSPSDEGLIFEKRN